jgi:hypothetical protein
MDKIKTFVIWLDGFLDASGDQLNIHQTNMIKNKLNRIFEHVAEEPSVNEVSQNPTLAELGEQHGFPVNDGFPSNLGSKDKDGAIMRC